MFSAGTFRRVALVLLILFDAALAGLNLPGHNNPPPARPHRRAGGESFPPLPLPATPVRRSERKREPSPPVLVAKIKYAKGLYNVTNDVRSLMHWANRTIKVSYRPTTLSWGRFSYDPTEMPIIYLTGHDPIPKLPKGQIQKLRAYLFGGGTLIANACCGAPEFTKSFRQLAGQLFPDRPLRRLSPEHPIFRCHHKVGKVRFQKGTSKSFTEPVLLEGVDLGCRTPLIFAPADLANGWYGQNPPKNYPPGFWIVKDDARKLGVNIVVYILSNLQYARSFPITQVQYRQAASAGETLTIGQLVHGGDWDPNPSALQRLQKYINENTTIPVAFKRAVVDPADPSIFEYPVIYIVGHRNFTFSDAQVTNLRRYLTQGGVLLAEACCGRKEFDLAFRRELKRVLPDRKLAPIPADHDIYNVNFRIGSVQLTDLARAYYKDLRSPYFEAIEISGRLAVIYSPLALGNGWEGIPHPFSAGYSGSDALRLGVNTFVYILSH